MIPKQTIVSLTLSKKNHGKMLPLRIKNGMLVNLSFQKVNFFLEWPHYTKCGRAVYSLTFSFS